MLRVEENVSDALVVQSDAELPNERCSVGRKVAFERGKRALVDFECVLKVARRNEIVCDTLCCENKRELALGVLVCHDASKVVLLDDRLRRGQREICIESLYHRRRLFDNKLAHGFVFLFAQLVSIQFALKLFRFQTHFIYQRFFFSLSVALLFIFANFFSKPKEKNPQTRARKKMSKKTKLSMSNLAIVTDANDDDDDTPPALESAEEAPAEVAADAPPEAGYNVQHDSGRVVDYHHFRSSAGRLLQFSVQRVPNTTLHRVMARDTSVDRTMAKDVASNDWQPVITMPDAAFAYRALTLCQFIANAPAPLDEEQLGAAWAKLVAEAQQQPAKTSLVASGDILSTLRSDPLIKIGSVSWTRNDIKGFCIRPVAQTILIIMITKSDIEYVCYAAQSMRTIDAEKKIAEFTALVNQQYVDTALAVELSPNPPVFKKPTESTAAALKKEKDKKLADIMNAPTSGPFSDKGMETVNGMSVDGDEDVDDKAPGAKKPRVAVPSTSATTTATTTTTTAPAVPVPIATAAGTAPAAPSTEIESIDSEDDDDGEKDATENKITLSIEDSEISAPAKKPTVPLMLATNK